MVLVLLYLDRDGQLADTACWRRCHASIKSRQTSPSATSDTTERKSGPSPADSLKVSQLAAGRDLLHGVGRRRRTESKQQASKSSSLTVDLPAVASGLLRRAHRVGVG